MALFEDKPSILTLNYDCLEAVMLHLAADELCTLSETCNRLHHVGVNVFSKKFAKNFIINERVNPRILHLFGDLITRLTIKTRVFPLQHSFDYLSDRASFNYCKNDVRRILLMVNRYCPNIEDMRTELDGNDRFNFRDIELGTRFENLRLQLDNDFAMFVHRVERAIEVENEEREKAIEYPCLPKSSLARAKPSIFDIISDSRLSYMFNYLDLDTLTSIADTCNQRILKISKSAFTQRYSNEFRMNCHTTAKTLRIFGELITNLKLCNIQYHDRTVCWIGQTAMIQLVHRYCPNITKFSIDHLDAQVYRNHSMRNIFKLVNDLKMSSSPLSYYAGCDQHVIETMECLKNVKHLNLDDTGKMLELCLKVEYPKLESIIVSSGALFERTLTDFCAVNSNIKHMELMVYGCYISDIVGVKQLKKLESFAMRCSANNPTLAQQERWVNVFQGFSSIDTLQSLSIMDDGAAVWRGFEYAQMPKLVQLTLGGRITQLNHKIWSDRLEMVARNMPNLRMCFGLEIENGHRLLSPILNFVRKSGTIEMLHVRWEGGTINDNVFLKFVRACGARTTVLWMEVEGLNRFHVSCKLLQLYSHVIWFTFKVVDNLMQNALFP